MQKEMETVFKTLSEGLKTLSQGIEKVAERIEEYSKTQKKAQPAAGKKTAAKAAPQPKKAAKKTAPKKSAPKKDQATTGIDEVYQIISRSKNGASAADIKAKTGFDDKRIHNTIYKLKKKGKIKSVKRGLYTKA